jgi:hypothetical protein
MERIRKSTLFALLGSCLLISSSCTVYYQTNDIDAKISTSIQSANDNCNRVIGQITAFENDYKNLKCVSTGSPYSDALKSMNEIDQSKLHIQSLQADIGKLYLDFKTYTKGKDAIASNTNEWKQFKTTKKALKLKFKELQSSGEKTVKEAEKFNVFINESIVPLVKKIDVALYIKNYEVSEMSCLEAQKELDQKIAKLEKDLQTIKAKMGRLYKDKYDLLEKDLTDMKTQRNELKTVYASLVYTIDSFQHQMEGKTIVYSCSSEWAIVNEAEKSFAEHQQKFTNIQTALLELQAHMQQVVLEIK